MKRHIKYDLDLYFWPWPWKVQPRSKIWKHQLRKTSQNMLGYCLELLIQDTCFCALNCYCSISLLLSLRIGIEMYRIVWYLFNLVCLEEKHDEFDCDFELELLLVFSFIVNYSPLRRIVEKGSWWENRSQSRRCNSILLLWVLEKKGGCSEVDSCYFKNPFSHLVML